MLNLNEQVIISRRDPAAVATSLLGSHGLTSATSGGECQGCGCAGNVRVGVSGDFAESRVVAELHGQALEAAGCTVSYRLDLPSRKASDAALFSGQIDLKPEYLASESTALDPNAKVGGTSTGNRTILRRLEAARGVNVLDFAPAVDTNVFVVTEATADRYHLSKMSDLATPGP